MTTGYASTEDEDSELAPSRVPPAPAIGLSSRPLNALVTAWARERGGVAAPARCRWSRAVECFAKRFQEAESQGEDARIGP